MTMDVFDPTNTPREEPIRFAARPQELSGLKVGLVDNTKFNSRVILEKIAARLKERHGVDLVHIDTKQSPSHGVSEDAVKAFKTKADFVIAGIGD